MSDLDALRRAMQAPPDEPFGPLDVDRIMARGKGIRRRRIAAIGSGATLATAVVLVIVTTLVRPSPPADPAQPLLPTVTAPVLSPPPAQPWGEVVRTGTQDANGEEVVFYFRKIDAADLPDVHFG